MAHLVRQKKTYWTDAAGRRVPADTPGATPVTETLKKWYGAGIPGLGAKRVPLAADKRVAQKMLQNLVTAAERGEAGLSDRKVAVTELEPLVQEFGTTVTRKSG